ncbi:hypothetical protein [Saccharopolyspora rosea]|uniref:Secreted protein n=1 Tax=Saccharopolyspora rosea TaxID=524884 RepID=A0ABW3FV69_9PSEU|nr:hypothetical protein [Saccharopolyspora rosea]
MLVVCGSFVLAVVFSALLLVWGGRASGQHSGPGQGATGVWQLCARVAQEREQEVEAARYGRHALRSPERAGFA